MFLRRWSRRLGKKWKFILPGFLVTNTDQAPVVQKLDSAIHRINHYPVEKYYEDRLRYKLDSDLPSG